MPNRILAKMEALGSIGGKSLSVVLMLGDPDFETSFERVGLAAEQGVDVVEVGIPTRNPFLDSPTMRESMSRALACSSDPLRYLNALREVRGRYPDLPLEVMIYSDTLHAIGLERYCEALGDAEMDATLVADIADQGPDYRRRLDEGLLSRDVLPIRFVPHPFRPEQVDDLRENGRGFIVVQTMTDAQGQRKAVLSENKQTLDTLRRAGIQVPLVLAYGIRTPQDVRRCMELGADGVLIGTVVLEAAHRLPKEGLAALLADLRQATAPPSTPLSEA